MRDTERERERGVWKISPIVASQVQIETVKKNPISEHSAREGRCSIRAN